MASRGVDGEGSGAEWLFWCTVEREREQGSRGGWAGFFFGWNEDEEYRDCGKWQERR